MWKSTSYAVIHGPSLDPDLGLPFSFLEVALLLVSTKNRELWVGPAPWVRDSWTSRQVWQIWLVENTKKKNPAHAQKIGSSQWSRFLLLSKRRTSASAQTSEEGFATGVSFRSRAFSKTPATQTRTGRMGYWPSERSRWLDIGKAFLLRIAHFLRTRVANPA